MSEYLAKYQKPTLQEVEAFVSEKGYVVNAQIFFETHEKRSWLNRWGNPLKDWKATIRQENVKLMALRCRKL